MYKMGILCKKGEFRGIIRKNLSFLVILYKYVLGNSPHLINVFSYLCSFHT